MRKFRTKAIVPVGIHILVEPLEQAAPEGQTILPVTSSDEAPSIGQVLAMGKGHAHPQHGTFVSPGGGYYDFQVPDPEERSPVTRRWTSTYGAGDVICYRKYTGAELVINGRTFLILTPDDILGIVGGEFVEEENPAENRDGRS